MEEQERINLLEIRRGMHGSLTEEVKLDGGFGDCAGRRGIGEFSDRIPCLETGVKNISMLSPKNRNG